LFVQIRTNQYPHLKLDNGYLPNLEIMVLKLTRCKDLVKKCQQVDHFKELEEEEKDDC